MRDTLDIASDVLLAAKDLAQRNQSRADEVILGHRRKSLVLTSNTNPVRLRNGFPQLSATGKVVSSELIQLLIDDES